MDLFKTLRQKVDTLGEGDYLPGLRAVVLHIETAHKHLERGQNLNEEPAFTDAIYRTNQAFEGSIKEAYRVFAGKDPAHQRPFDIEKYLENQKVFRARVLAQLTNYRTEWRNPSAHDYKLDFDESEAFLAIVSVSAFACLLLDQMAERLSFDSAKALADSEKNKLKKALPSESANLLERSVAILHAFTRQRPKLSSSTQPAQSEVQLLGALAGFIASVAPDLAYEADTRLIPERHVRGDLLLVRGSEKVLVELKQARISRQMLHHDVAQLEHYLMLSKIRCGILFSYTKETCELQREDRQIPSDGGKIVILSPKRKEPNKE